MTLTDKLKPELENYGQLAQVKELIPQAIQGIGKPVPEGQPSPEDIINHSKNVLANLSPRLTDMIAPQSYANMPVEDLISFTNAYQGTVLENLVGIVDSSPQELFEGIVAKEDFEDRDKFAGLVQFVYQMKPGEISEDYRDVAEALDKSKSEAEKYLDDKGKIKEGAPQAYLSEFDDVPLIQSAVASYLERGGMALIQDYVVNYQNKVAECFVDKDEEGNQNPNFGKLTGYLAANFSYQEKPVKANIALGATNFYFAEPRESEAGEGEAE